MPDPNTLISAGTAAVGAASAAAAARAVYRDVLQPTVREAGTTLAEIVKAKLLVPLRDRVLSTEDAASVAAADVAERLVGTPPEHLLAPPAEMVGEAVEALRTRAGDPDLRAMFANVLASAMHYRTAPETHPAFVEVLRQLTGEDAHLLRLLTNPELLRGAAGAETTHPAPGIAHTTYIYPDPWGRWDGYSWAPSALQLANLSRLGLAQMVTEEMPRTQPGLRIRGTNKHTERLVLTDFGHAFARACFLGPQGASPTSDRSAASV